MQRGNDFTGFCFTGGDRRAAVNLVSRNQRHLSTARLFHGIRDQVAEIGLFARSAGPGKRGLHLNGLFCR